MRYISLFSGAMGLDLGLERAGLACGVAVEMDATACKTIRRNTCIPVLEGDIGRITSKELTDAVEGPVFAVVGGPPCQSFSTMGARRGTGDSKGEAMLEFIRVVREVRPPYFVMENVRGLLSTPIGAVPEGYDTGYGGMADRPGSMMFLLWNEFSRMGYHVSFALFNCANYGVPQKRERVVMMGSLKSRIPLPAPTHGDSGLSWVAFGDAVQGLEKCDHVRMPRRLQRYLMHIREGENWKALPEELQRDYMGGYYNSGGGMSGYLRRLSRFEPAPTLMTSPVMNSTLLCHPTLMRPLSVQEYARVQQFPDDWVFEGSLGDRYRQIGNAVPVGMGEVVGRALVDHHNGVARPEIANAGYSRYRGTTDREFIPAFLKSLRGR